jgi:saccharopine dehydrogenase (NADP+, L-glutamate forming)
MPNQETVLVLLSTDQFSFPLIRYLALEANRFGWKLCIASMFADNCLNRIREEKFSKEPIFITINDFAQCHHAIKKSELVIALVPDVMLLMIADSCIEHKRTLISPGLLTRQMVKKKTKAEQNGVLLLFECGFAPGLDHVTAKKAIDTIHAKGGKIHSFKTYSGSQIVHTGIDNPWHYKLTEPASELISMGKGNNRHIVNGQLQQIPYHQLMDRAKPISIKGLESMIAIPEGDSLYYRKVYGLTETKSVLKGKLVHREFGRLWDLVIRLGLTDHASRVDLIEKKSFYEYLKSILPYSGFDSPESILSRRFNASYAEIKQLKWLGLFNDSWVSDYKDVTGAVILKYLLEEKLSITPADTDCIIMRHELDYTWRNTPYNFTATLIASGEGDKNSALAKAIGLTTGAAAKNCLLGNIKIKGLYTPTKKELYDPMLNELDDLGVTFTVEEKKVYEAEVNLN